MFRVFIIISALTGNLIQGEKSDYPTSPEYYNITNMPFHSGIHFDREGILQYYENPWKFYITVSFHSLQNTVNTLVDRFNEIYNSIQMEVRRGFNIDQENLPAQMSQVKDQLEALKNDCLSFGNTAKNDGWVYKFLGEVLSGSEIVAVNQNINNLYLRQQRARTFIHNSTIFVRSLIDDFKFNSCWENFALWNILQPANYTANMRAFNFSFALDCISHDATMFKKKIEHFLLSETLQKISIEVVSELSVKNVLLSILEVTGGLVESLNLDEDYFKNLEIRKEVYGAFASLHFEIPVFSRIYNLYRAYPLPIYSNETDLFLMYDFKGLDYFSVDDEFHSQVFSESYLQNCRNDSNRNQRFKCQLKTENVTTTTPNDLKTCLMSLYLNREEKSECNDFLRIFNISKPIWYLFEHEKYFFATSESSYFYLNCLDLLPSKISYEITGMVEIHESCFIQIPFLEKEYVNVTKNIDFNQFVKPFSQVGLISSIGNFFSFLKSFIL